MTYEELLVEAENNNLIVKEKPLPISKGRIKGNRVAIRKGMAESEKACILAEELGHHYTAVGDIIDQSNAENRKQELRGRIWAYNKQIGLTGLVNAYRSHCQNAHEVAEYLGVTDEFLADSLDYYRSKYGCCVQIDNFVIFFEPNIAVMELI